MAAVRGIAAPTKKRANLDKDGCGDDVVERLSVVVPFRARPEHLALFVPHMRSYFARDKGDRHIPYSVLIVEQSPGLPFNRGALKNVGFQLGQNASEYTCFHDIDYLPIWSDYSWTSQPTPLVWYGAEERPVSSKGGVIRHDMDHFYGGALLVPNDTFRSINGYGIDYWGWGYEDLDLIRRFEARGIAVGRRKGTYHPLNHDNEGFRSNGAPSAAAETNLSLYRQRWESGSGPGPGLDQSVFEITDRRPISDAAPEREATWELVKVRLAHKPPGWTG